MNINVPITAAVLESLNAGTPLTISLALTPPTVVEAGGSGGPKPAPVPTPKPAPAPTSADTTWIFKDGVDYWDGDWDSSGSSNYGYVASDGTKSMLFTPSGSNSIWLPHPKAVAGNPQNNGIAVNLTGKTKLVFDIRPHVAGMQVQGALYNVSGVFTGFNSDTQDEAITGPLLYTQSKYGPASPAENAWNHYEVPLKDLGMPWEAGSIGWWAYKAGFQIEGASGAVEYNNVGFQ